LKIRSEKQEIFTVFLPELLGNDFQVSFKNLLKLWEIFRKNSFLVPSGLCFEIQCAKVFKGMDLEYVFLEFLRIFLVKLPNGERLFRKSLSALIQDDVVYVDCRIEQGGISEFGKGQSEFVEVFDSK
jgi:hypothetical protein